VPKQSIEEVSTLVQKLKFRRPATGIGQSTPRWKWGIEQEKDLTPESVSVPSAALSAQSAKEYPIYNPPRAQKFGETSLRIHPRRSRERRAEATDHNILWLVGEPVQPIEISGCASPDLRY
jgi:hypothetical protein